MENIAAKITGLKTNPSYITAPAGGLSIASNVNVDAPDTATSRRGFYKYGFLTSGSVSNNVSALTEFQDKIIQWYNNKLAYDNGAGVFTEYSGAFTPEKSNVGIRFLEANSAKYCSTNNGVKKLEQYNGAWTNSGGVKAIQAEGTAVIQSSLGFMDNNTQRAYRIIWGIKDTNDFLVLGEPSGRIEVINVTGDPADVSLTIYIPSGITTTHFFQVYRSSASADASTVGSDEMYLVYEDNPSAGEITAGVLTILDSVPDTLAGATIYTAPTQEGISQANTPPPSCVDMTYYKDMAVYANTRQKHAQTITLVAIGGTDGLQTNDTITIAGVTYTAKGAETIPSGEFKLETGLTTAENITATMLSLVNVINQYAANTAVYAYYISGFDELPGKVYIERRDYTDSTFYITVSAHGVAFDPTLPTTGTSASSTSDDFGHYVYFSKKMQPEAVPLLNFLPVGSASSEILRVIALRDSIFVFKDDGEIWRLIGEEFSSMSVTLFDNTVKLLAPKTATVYNNQVFAMSNQGVVSISDSGTRVVSYDIENQLKSLISPTISPNFDTLGFAVAYESDRKYILCDTSQAWVYNGLTSSWTVWDIEFFSGMVKESDDKLYWGDRDGYLRQERKTLTKFDFVDEEFEVEIMSYSGYDVVVFDSTGVEVGDALKQGSRWGIVEAVNGNTLTMSTQKLWELGTGTSALIQKPIICELEFLPMLGGAPQVVKRWHELVMFFSSMNNDFTVSYTNNFSPSLSEAVTITPDNSGSAWGSFIWGSQPWGGSEGLSQENRTYFPLGYARAIWQKVKITTELPYTSFSLIAVIAYFEATSSKFSKDIA